MRAKVSLERDIWLDKLQDTGKPRKRWLDRIKEAPGLRLEALTEQFKIEKNGTCWW
jgi:hypothetical protein